MLTLNQLVENIQTRLNNASTLEFKLYTHMGKYQKAKQRKRVINGIATVTASDTTATQEGYDLATMSVKIDFLIKCKDTEDEVHDYDGDLVDQGNTFYISQVADVLNSVASQQVVETMADADGTQYAYSLSMSLVNTGTLEYSPQIGKRISFTLYAEFNIVQNGLNSRNKQYTLDGLVIPYTASTAGRTPVCEGDVYSGEQVAKTTVTASTLFLSLSVPAFIGALYNHVEDWIYNGALKTHILTVTNKSATPNRYFNYFVFFGETSEAAEGILNVGGKIAFTETKFDKDRSELADGLYTYNVEANTTVTFQGSSPDDIVTVYAVKANKWYNVKVSVGVTLDATDTLISTRKKTGDTTSNG